MCQRGVQPPTFDTAEDSDRNLVAQVDEKTPELEQALDEIAYQLMWNHVLKPLISLKVFSEERLLIAAAKGLAFFGMSNGKG